MADNRVAYGLAKKYGIDTSGMSPKEVWEALKKKGVTEENISKEAYDIKENKTLNQTGVIKKKKSIRSLNKTIEKHKDKIKSPEVYVKEWNNLPEINKRGLIHYWEKEIIQREKEINKIKKEIGEYDGR